MDELELRNDGVLINALTGMGTGKDRSIYTQLVLQGFLSKTDAEALYLEWLPRRVVDIVADECTRAGFSFTLGDGDGSAQGNQSLINDVQQSFDDRGWMSVFNEGLKIARLYGGCAVAMAIDDGQEADQPVNVRNIKAIKGLYPLDRWRVYPLMNDQVILDLSKPPLYGISYSVASEGIRRASDKGQQVFKIHPSRILRLDGEFLPWQLRQQNQGWGASSLQRILEAYKHYQTGIAASAGILDSFDLFVHKLKGLSSMIAAGREGDLRTRLNANQMSRSVYQGMVIDADGEDVSFVSRTVGGVSDVLDRLRQEIQGATGIPHTLLFGDSPSGMGASGRSEERDFAKTCQQYQEAHLRRPLRKLLRYMMLAQDGPTKGKVPDNWSFTFNDLYVPYPEEVAALRAQIASVDSQYITAGVLTAEEVAQSRFGGTQWSMETTLDREAKAPNHADATQQTNLYQTLKSINAGELPIDTGVALVQHILGCTEKEAKAIVASAGEAVAKQMEQEQNGPVINGGEPGAAAPPPEGADEQLQEPDDTAADAAGVPTLDSADPIALVRHSGITVAVMEEQNGIRRGHVVTPHGQRHDTGLDWVAIAGDSGKTYRVDWLTGESAWVLGCKTRATAKGALKRLGCDMNVVVHPIEPIEVAIWAE